MIAFLKLLVKIKILLLNLGFFSLRGANLSRRVTNSSRKISIELSEISPRFSWSSIRNCYKFLSLPVANSHDHFMIEDRNLKFLCVKYFGSYKTLNHPLFLSILKENTKPVIPNWISRKLELSFVSLIRKTSNLSLMITLKFHFSDFVIKFTFKFPTYRFLIYFHSREVTLLQPRTYLNIYQNYLSLFKSLIFNKFKNVREK